MKVITNAMEAEGWSSPGGTYGFAIDIETVPWVPGMDSRLATPKEFAAPANYKDPAKIAEAVRIKQLAWRKAVRDGAALSPLTGAVACAVVQPVDRECRPVGDAVGIAHARLEESEREIDALVALSMVTRAHGIFPAVVTFNGSSFDLPFLRARYVVCGLLLPDAFRPQPRYKSYPHLDTRAVLTNWAYHSDDMAKGKLPEWCRIMQVTPPIDHTPAEIEALQSSGNLDRLCEICASDVMATAGLAERLVGTGVVRFPAKRDEPFDNPGVY